MPSPLLVPLQIVVGGDISKQTQSTEETVREVAGWYVHGITYNTESGTGALSITRRDLSKPDAHATVDKLTGLMKSIQSLVNGVIAGMEIVDPQHN